MARKRKTTPVSETPLSEKELSERGLLQIRNLTAEFFDHAIILVSREIKGETVLLNCKLGNDFAIKGMMSVFMNEFMNDELEDVEEIEGELEIDDDDNDGDDWKKVH
jgi:hypothetical protein